MPPQEQQLQGSPTRPTNRQPAPAPAKPPVAPTEKEYLEAYDSFSKRMGLVYTEAQMAAERIKSLEAKTSSSAFNPWKRINGDHAASVAELNAERVHLKEFSELHGDMTRLFVETGKKISGASLLPSADRARVLAESLNTLSNYRPTASLGKDLAAREEASRLRDNSNGRLDTMLSVAYGLRDYIPSTVGAATATVMLAVGGAPVIAAVAGGVAIGVGASLIVNAVESGIEYFHDRKSAREVGKNFVNHTASEGVDSVIASSTAALAVKLAGSIPTATTFGSKLAAVTKVGVAAAVTHSALSQTKSYGDRVIQSGDPVSSLPAPRTVAANLVSSAAIGAVTAPIGFVTGTVERSLGGIYFTHNANGETTAFREFGRLAAKTVLRGTEISADTAVALGALRMRQTLAGESGPTPTFGQTLATVATTRAVGIGIQALRAQDEKLAALKPLHDELEAPSRMRDVLTGLRTRSAIALSSTWDLFRRLQPGASELFRLGGDEFALVYKTKNGDVHVGAIDFNNVGVPNDVGLRPSVNAIFGKLKEVAWRTLAPEQIGSDPSTAVKNFVTEVQRERNLALAPSNLPAGISADTLKQAEIISSARTAVKGLVAEAGTALGGPPQQEQLKLFLGDKFQAQHGTPLQREYPNLVTQYNEQYNTNLPPTYSGAKAEDMALVVALAARQAAEQSGAVTSNQNTLVGISIGLVNVGKSPTPMTIQQALAQGDRILQASKSSATPSFKVHELDSTIQVRAADQQYLRNIEQAESRHSGVSRMLRNWSYPTDQVRVALRDTAGRDANSGLPHLNQVARTSAFAVFGFREPETPWVIKFDIRAFGAINHLGVARADSIYQQMVGMVKAEFPRTDVGIRMDGGSMYLFTKKPTNIDTLGNIKTGIESMITRELQQGGTFPQALMNEVGYRNVFSRWLGKPEWEQQLGTVDVSLRAVRVEPNASMVDVMRLVNETPPAFRLPNLFGGR